MQSLRYKEEVRAPETLCSAGEDRVNVLGVGISAISMSDAIFFSDEILQGPTPGYICVTGVHGVVEAQYDDQLKSTLNGSFLTTPDGMPMVWLGHWFRFNKMTRVSGPEYMVEMCKLSVERGYRHFLYGGKDGTAEALRKALTKRFPGLQIAGTYTPPFRPLTADEESDLERQVRESKADILWCGISTPKQERFMAKYCGVLPVKLMIGVGAAFDIHSGNTKDAPDWIKNSGMHWLLRMLRDPRRLAGRYLKNNPRFLWLIALQLSGLRHFFMSRPATLLDVPSTAESSAEGSPRQTPAA